MADDSRRERSLGLLLAEGTEMQLLKYSDDLLELAPGDLVWLRDQLLGWAGTCSELIEEARANDDSDLDRLDPLLKYRDGALVDSSDGKTE